MITWPLRLPPFLFYFIAVPSLLDSRTFPFPVTEVISAAKRTSVAAHIAASARGIIDCGEAAAGVSCG